jgi:hypothetical protein
MNLVCPGSVCLNQEIEMIHLEVSDLPPILNKQELPEQWKESIIVPVYKKGDKTDCSNYRGISLLSASYNILSNILLSRLSPYLDEIFGDHQCGLILKWILEK